MRVTNIIQYDRPIVVIASSSAQKKKTHLRSLKGRNKKERERQTRPRILPLRFMSKSRVVGFTSAPYHCQQIFAELPHVWTDVFNVPHLRCVAIMLWCFYNNPNSQTLYCTRGPFNLPTTGRHF